MKQILFYCNKCSVGIKHEDLTESENNEIGYNMLNDKVPSFVCSDCINKEMQKIN